MTIEDFRNKFNLKNEKKILNWIDKGYIPGVKRDAETNEFIIPELAHPPYTEARAKNANSIYQSIVKACINRKGVCAKLYKLDETEFQIYISQLSEAGYIHIETRANIQYYFATEKSYEFLNNSKSQKLLKECLEIITENTAKGITAACLEKAMA